MRKIQPTKWARARVILTKMFVIFVILDSLLGGLTFYHFYLQPTGIFYKDSRKQVSRAVLVDVVIQNILKGK